MISPQLLKMVDRVAEVFPALRPNCKPPLVSCTDAWLLGAIHAAMAYLTPAEIRDVAARVSRGSLYPPTVVPWSAANARGYVWIDKGNAIVSIAGSDDLADWLQNAMTSRPTVSPWLSNEPLPGVPRIHRGFLEHTEQTLAALDGCKHWLRTNKVTFVGHSLGGAVAMLAASVTNDASRVMTFGAPRVGDQTFAEHIGAHCELLQFWNVGDPVPHLPLADPWRGYRHPTPQRYLAADGTVYQSRAAVWLDLFRAVGLRCGRALELVLPAHQMSAYLDRLSLATGLG